MTPTKVAVWTSSLILMGLPAFATAFAEPAGPSEEQIALVTERRATFPVRTIVQSVDWYKPLEPVAGQPRPFPKAQSLSPAQAQQLDEFATKSDSFALLVARHGKLVYEYYASGFQANSRYDTASMHKAVVALMVGVAVKDGFIKSVDDRLDRYLPELSADPRGAITLRQMLEMNSGLKTPPISDSSASPYWQTYFGANLTWSVGQWPFERHKQGEFYYANANTQYLLWAIERASGQRYASYLSDRLWRPIGAGEARVWLDKEGGNGRGFCCLQASALDWMRVGELVRNGGKWRGTPIVSSNWVAQMLAPSKANANFGWNVWRGSPYNPKRTYGPGIPAIVEARAPFKRADTYYFDGSGGQRVYIIPSEKMVSVRIGTPKTDWDDSYLPNLLLTEKR